MVNTESQPNSGTNPLAMDVQRVYVFGGLLLIAAGMLFGDIFAMFILHPNNARIGEAMFAASQLVPEGDVDGIMAHFGAIGGFLENRGTKVDAHSHAIHVGYIALLLAILQPWAFLSSGTRKFCAWLFTICAFLLPVSIFMIHYVGLAYSPWAFIGWASVLADLTGGLLALVMFIQLWGLWQGRDGNTSALTDRFGSGGEGASKVLLLGGCLLLACGFLYGVGYAAWLQSGTAVAELDILKPMVEHAAASQQDLLAQDFANYGNYQMYKAINVAAHTHINEMGILLLLLSFVQGLIAYGEAARRRWAMAAAIGAVFLPVGILLEIPYGFVGSVIADTAGFVVIISLLAMLKGLFAQSGSAGGQS